MSGRAAADCDVLVVGLGPVGAALSALLAREGLRVVAIDRDTVVYPLPRAAHFDHEIMRVFQRLGVADAILPHVRASDGYTFLSARGETLLRFDRTAARSASGWRSNYMMHQPAVESALRASLAASPLVDIRLGARYIDHEETGDGARVRVADDHGTRTIDARFVVGCDGATSAVRKTLGATLDDYGFDEPWLVVDVRVGPGARLPAINTQHCDPARPTTCVLMGPGRHRWEFMLKPGENADEALDEARIRTWLAPWGGPSDLEIERKAVYRFHGLVARRWRVGRALLAGDAAHQMPPFAGQGMCSGIRDAANLSWKLARVARGDSPPSLLDTYQVERDPQVRAIVETAVAMGRVVCTLDPDAAAARDAEMLVRRAAGLPGPAVTFPPIADGVVLAGTPGAGVLFPQPWTDGESTPARFDDVAGDGFWLIVDDAGGPGVAGLRRISLSDPAFQPFSGPLRTWLDDHDVEAVLVRPDRYVFGAGNAVTLSDAIRHQLT